MPPYVVDISWGVVIVLLLMLLLPLLLPLLLYSRFLVRSNLLFFSNRYRADLALLVIFLASCTGFFTSALLLDLHNFKDIYHSYHDGTLRYDTHAEVPYAIVGADYILMYTTAYFVMSRYARDLIGYAIAVIWLSSVYFIIGKLIRFIIVVVYNFPDEEISGFIESAPIGIAIVIISYFHDIWALRVAAIDKSEAALRARRRWAFLAIIAIIGVPGIIILASRTAGAVVYLLYLIVAAPVLLALSAASLDSNGFAGRWLASVLRHIRVGYPS